MNSSYRLLKPFLVFRCRVYTRDCIRTLIRQSVLCNRVIIKQQAPYRLFTTCSPAYVKSVHKFGRKVREKLLAKAKINMSGDSIQALAPLQAAVKEKVSLSIENNTLTCLLQHGSIQYLHIIVILTREYK